MKNARLAPLLLVSALAACGTGLYDAAGVPTVDDGGTGLTCDVGQVACVGVCTTENRNQCGAICQDCVPSGVDPPANGAWACLAGGTCGYECAKPTAQQDEFVPDGYLKCNGGCCGTTALSAGPAFTCALLDDATVRCWGENLSGQLGDGTTSDRHAPVAVPIANAIAVGAGHQHVCAVVTDGVDMTQGAVLCWGANEGHQVTSSPVSPVLAPAATPILTGASAVVAGVSHTCALIASTGEVRCWGSDALGQLGGATNGAGASTPIASGAASLTAGANHTCAVMEVAGEVRCWGDNASGQLGTTLPSLGAIVTPIGSGIAVVAASAGQSCTSTGVSNMPANIDDVVKCWGASLGPLFDFAEPQTTPAIPMRDGSHSTIRGDDVTMLAVGRRHACYRNKIESVSCLGPDNTRGQLGSTPVGPTETAPVALPVVVGLPIARALAAGADHTCAALGDGRLRCWGANERGQLGDGNPAATPPDPGVGVIVAPSGR